MAAQVAAQAATALVDEAAASVYYQPVTTAAVLICPVWNKKFALVSQQEPPS